MPAAPGIGGHIRVDNDFICGAYADVVWGTGVLVSNAFDPFGFTSVNEGSFASTIDEPGGILDITTDNAQGDNAFLFCGTFFPRDGGMRMGARYKINNLDLLTYCGYQETLSLTTPVIAVTFSTVTMTYANVESRFINLLTLAGRPWIARLEHAISNLLPGRLIVRADIDELLRTDTQTRVNVQTQRIRSGLRSVNEERAVDNLPPIDGGDVFLWPPFALDVAKELLIEDAPTDPQEMQDVEG
jgi:hypothetical protein